MRDVPAPASAARGRPSMREGAPVCARAPVLPPARPRGPRSARAVETRPRHAETRLPKAKPAAQQELAHTE